MSLLLISGIIDHYMVLQKTEELIEKTLNDKNKSEEEKK